MKYSLFFLFFYFSFVVYSQEIKWNTLPRKGCVYQITNKEAKNLLTYKATVSSDYQMLHTLVDTFDVTKGWVNRPTKGHFLLTSVAENNFHINYTSVFPYQVLLLSTYDALSLQVLDFDGKIRKDAKVKLGFRRIHFDYESKTYRLENDWITNNFMFATVELDGFQSFFSIQRYPVRLWNNNYYQSENYQQFFSYLITDKNRYKPNEHVRFKSYALNVDKKPIKEELLIWISYPKNICVGRIKPHRPGSFAGEFHLHDSLKLTLDKNYSFEMRTQSGRVVSNCNFKYEDYELMGDKLELNFEKPTHFFPDSNALIISATDVNGLPLKDARATITLKTHGISETFQPFVMLRDTLVNQQINLDPEQPTRWVIPPSLFEKCNLGYSINVLVTNSQNQRLEKRLDMNFVYSAYEIKSKYVNDSICIELLNNQRVEQDVSATITYDDNNLTKSVVLPYKEKINPALKLVTIKTDICTKQLSMSNISPYFEILGGVNVDSINIKLENPQKIFVSWYLFYGNNLLKKGSGVDFSYDSLLVGTDFTYSLDMVYSFGGREHLMRKDFEFREDMLNVTLDVPDKIYPGQTVDAIITVSDIQGNPVRNVDLTAFAVNAKLDYRIGNLPNYGSISSARAEKAHFSKSEVNNYATKLPLDYKKWSVLYGLDTMKYYNFTYPKKNPYRYTVDCTDSTQFTIYAMKDGEAMQIYVIEVDNVPVYFSWVDMPNKYSFYVTPSKPHQITLRLFNSVIVLDSIYFEKSKKTILSLDVDKTGKNINQMKLIPTFFTSECIRYLKYVSSFRTYSMNTYLMDSKGFTPVEHLLPYTNRSNPLKIGPINEGYKTYFRIKEIEYRYKDNMFISSSILRNDSTRYRHEGGYEYQFEDNVVYKLKSENLIPNKLQHITYNPLNNINDFVLTKTKFLDLTHYSKSSKWNNRTISANYYGLKLKILLPHDVFESGIRYVLLEDRDSKKLDLLFSNNQLIGNKNVLLRKGNFNTIVLYNNGYYLKMDSTILNHNSTSIVDMNTLSFQPPDSIYNIFINNQTSIQKFNFSTTDVQYDYTNKNNESLFYLQNGNIYNVRGKVNDDLGEMFGVGVVVKGTTQGVLTDINGNFKIQIQGDKPILVFRMLGYKDVELEVKPGDYVTVMMETRAQELNEATVIGYGTKKREENLGSQTMVRSDDLSKVAASSFDQSAGFQKTEEDIVKDSEKRLYEELLTLNSLRSNFSDVGFWEPKLFTDKHGKSSFKIKFPDDITRWEAVVYAMNKRLQTGTARKSILSYKPIMGELHVPQFLTVGDSAYLLGRVLNYSSDSILNGKIKWSSAQNNKEANVSFKQFYTDKFLVNPTTLDTVVSSFQFVRDDGYQDGEKRSISVVDQGIARVNGHLSILSNNTTTTFKADSIKKLYLAFYNNPVNIFEQEISSLVNYQYACNEQLASKLIGLLNYKKMKEFKGEIFEYGKDINNIIAKLLKNQNQDYLWSWWNQNFETSYWMSAHILRALKMAKDEGYLVTLNVDNIARIFNFKVEKIQNSLRFEGIEMVHCMATWGANINYTKYVYLLDSMIQKFEADERINAIEYESKYSRIYTYTSFLKLKLILQEIKLLTNNGYDREFLLKYQKSGIFGEVYFTDDKREEYWYYDKFNTNIIAYRIAHRDSTLNHLLEPMQMYFLSKYAPNQLNTYTSANFLAYLFPDLIKAGYNAKKTEMILTGKINTTIDVFPHYMQLEPGEEINVQRQNGTFVFCAQYEYERVTKAKSGVDGFKIQSYFENHSSNLKAGIPVTLKVEVVVKKEMKLENVMIEVPIPAACSYAKKSAKGFEVHREYFKEKTVIFLNNLNRGKYIYEIELLPRFTGKYTLNPAQVSLMYVPVINANTDLKKVKVSDN